MTMAPFTCATFADSLAAHLERDDTPAVRIAMESHRKSCAECAALLADLTALRESAASLPTLRPARDLWAGIESRIEAPVVPIIAGGTGAAAAPAARHRSWTRPALAAAALVAITAGVTHVATREALREGVQQPASVAVLGAAPTTDPIVTPDASPLESVRPSSSAAGTAPATAVAAPHRPAPLPATQAAFAEYRVGEMAPLDSVYGREILRLRSIVSQRRSDLDSTTVQVLDRNMAVIDRAIRECRAALARDPASHYLNEQLNQALESKIELLRSAATVPIGS